MDYKDYAKEVIISYPISYQEIEFIRHNENMIFKIIDEINNKAYVLRIHKSNINGLSGIQHTYEGLKSEMEFLHYLSNNEALKVQSPIANNTGDYVTIHTLDASSTPFYSTLLEWIEGATLTLKEDNLDDIVFSFGEKLALFHEASRLFKPNKDFARPIYSMGNLKMTIDDLKYGIEIGLYNNDQYELMKKVVNIIIEKVTELDVRSDSWGIIHADFQLGNIIIHNEKPSFIDFGLSGYGYYLFDLGSAATILESHTRDNFLRGYASRTAFAFDDLKYIDCLIFADVFISYMLFIKDEQNRGWIKEHAASIDNLFHKFIEGEIVFYSL